MSASPTVDGVTGQVGTITRDDGSKQVTLDGLPLYLYAGDAKAGDTTRENPWPVRALAQRMTEYVARAPAAWIEGQIAQINTRSGSPTAFLTLRDASVSMSLQVTCARAVLAALPTPPAEGSRVVVHGRGETAVLTGGATVVVAEVEAALRAAVAGDLLVLGLPHPELGEVVGGVAADAARGRGAGEDDGPGLGECGHEGAPSRSARQAIGAGPSSSMSFLMAT